MGGGGGEGAEETDSPYTHNVCTVWAELIDSCRVSMQYLVISVLRHGIMYTSATVDPSKTFYNKNLILMLLFLISAMCVCVCVRDIQSLLIP